MKWHPQEPDSALFPKLDKFLVDEFCPRVRKNKKIWKAFKKYSGLDNTAATNAIEFGKSKPFVVVDELPGNGRFKKSEPNSIFIDLDVAIAFEKHANRLKRVVESTLLHEMVHWARHNDGDPKTKSGMYKSFEVGKRFECAAYGGDIGMSRKSEKEKIKSKNIKGGTKYRKFECATRRARGS